MNFTFTMHHTSLCRMSTNFPILHLAFAVSLLYVQHKSFLRSDNKASSYVYRYRLLQGTEVKPWNGTMMFNALLKTHICNSCGIYRITLKSPTMTNICAFHSVVTHYVCTTETNKKREFSSCRHVMLVISQFSLLLSKSFQADMILCVVVIIIKCMLYVSKSYAGVQLFRSRPSKSSPLISYDKTVITDAVIIQWNL